MGQVVKAFVVLSDRFSEVSSHFLQVPFIHAPQVRGNPAKEKDLIKELQVFPQIRIFSPILFAGARESNNSAIQVPSKDWVRHKPAQDSQWQDKKDWAETQRDNWNPCVGAGSEIYNEN